MTVIGVAVIAPGGTGGTYAVNDVLTVSGGTFTTAATLKVTGVTAGKVTAAIVLTPGAYSVNPSNPVSVTGGGGTGATFNLTFSTPMHDLNLDGRSFAAN